MAQQTLPCMSVLAVAMVASDRTAMFHLTHVVLFLAGVVWAVPQAWRGRRSRAWVCWPWWPWMPAPDMTAMFPLARCGPGVVRAAAQAWRGWVLVHLSAGTGHGGPGLRMPGPDTTAMFSLALVRPGPRPGVVGAAAQAWPGKPSRAPRVPAPDTTAMFHLTHVALLRPGVVAVASQACRGRPSCALPCWYRP